MTEADEIKIIIRRAKARIKTAQRGIADRNFKIQKARELISAQEEKLKSLK